MDTNELGFNAWILVGNVLHSLLRGANPVAHGAGRDRLQRLDTLLEPIQPTQMLQTLQSLPNEDRQLLLEACIAARIAAGADADTALGLSQSDTAPVLQWLQNAQ